MNKTLTLEITAVYDKLKSALSSIASLFKDAFDFTKAEIQFNRLLGDFDKATKLVRELREAGKTGAFGFSELAAGMKSLLKYSGGDLGTDTLNKLADFAAATDTPLETLTKTFGRFYQSLSTGGTDFERTVRELENFGLITKELKTQLIEMGAKGTPAIEIWKLINQQLEKFNGVNEELTNTTEGQLEKFGNELKDIGVTLAESLIPAISAVLPLIEASIPLIDGAARSISGLIGYSAKFAKNTIGYAWDGVKAAGGVIWDGAMAVSDIVLEGIKSFDLIPDKVKDAAVIIHENTKQFPELLQDEYKDFYSRPEKPTYDNVEKPNKTVEATLQNVTVDTSKPVEQETKKAEGYSNALLDALSEITNEYNDQVNKVRQLNDALINLSKTLTQAYSSSLTTTGKIGGYQSQVEQTRAAATFNPELNELQTQTEILKSIRDNAQTQYGLTL